MRSLVYVGPEGLEWQETPEPVLRADHEALVRPVASASCDLDRRIVSGSTPMEPPFALGHEAVGEIVDLGTEAAAGGLTPGARVAIPWHLSCGTCVQCRARRPGNCTSTPALAGFGQPLGGLHGGLYDDLVRVPWASHALTPVPDVVPSELAASCSDQMADAYGAVAPTLAEQSGASVLIVGGLPSLGLWAVMFAAALGAEEVVYVDPDPVAADLAVALGATRTISEVPDRVDGEFALTVDVGGDPERTLGCAFRSVAPGGTVVGRCVYFVSPPLPYWDLFRTDARFVTSPPHATPWIPAILELLASAAVDPSPVLTTGLSYDDAPEILLERPRKPVFSRTPGHSGMNLTI